MNYTLNFKRSIQIHNQMTSNTLKTRVCFFILCLCSLTQVNAQELVTVRKIKAGVYISPPFVMKDSIGYYSGMAIELWNLIEDEMNLKTEYLEYTSWRGMIDALINGEIEVAVSNISVTYERAQLLKFSFPWYDAGLRIMVKTTGNGSIWMELRRNGHLQAYLWITAALLILTIALTIIHRRRESDFPRNWIEGLAESLYRLVLAIKTGVVNNDNYSWLGKVLAVFWMISGIGLVAYVTSSITSSMTTVALTHDIHSLNDLPGKRVGVLGASVAEQYLQNWGIPTISYEMIQELTQALADDQIDAIVEDAPILEYWAFNNPDKQMRVIGNIFHPDKYAFAATRAYSGQMDSISVEIIKLFDREKISEIKNRYFGNIH